MSKTRKRMIRIQYSWHDRAHSPEAENSYSALAQVGGRESQDDDGVFYYFKDDAELKQAMVADKKNGFEFVVTGCEEES